MSATCGLTSETRFASYDPATRSWRTWPDTALWGSTEYSATWPRTGCMLDGRAYERPTSEPRTAASASSSSSHLPTPTARDHKGPNQRGDRSCLAGALLPTPSATDKGSGQDPAKRRGAGHQIYLSDVASQMEPPVAAAGRWGKYEPAIRRWEAATRPAPEPTEPNRNGRPRLAARFAEWLMGMPDGWVVSVPGVSRADQLKALGNGVCPQQAAAAIRRLVADADTDGRTPRPHDHREEPEAA